MTSEHIATHNINGRDVQVIAVFQDDETTADFFDIFDGHECLNEGAPFWEIPTKEEIAQFLSDNN